MMEYYHRLAAALSSPWPESVVLALVRLTLAGIFWRSGRTKVADGELLTLSDSTWELFRTEYSGVPLPPDFAAIVATGAEHLFPILLVAGLFTRGAALALLIMTAVIQLCLSGCLVDRTFSLDRARSHTDCARRRFDCDGFAFHREAVCVKSEEAILAQLAAMAQRGDRVAYATFLSESQLWLKRYFLRKVGPDYLEDVVQETLLSVHKKLASYDPNRPLMPWLAAIARYRWVDHLRLKYKAMRQNDIRDEITNAWNSVSEIPARISLDQLLNHLSESQAKAIEMVKIEGLSVAEAASVTGQSEALIKVNVHRGLKKLAAMIDRA